MHGLTGGDCKRAVICGDCASPRSSHFEMLQISPLVVAAQGAGLVSSSPSRRVHPIVGGTG
jgi:hypothetical protein